MQSTESRLIKAAKRTIRAEATLVIIIIIITSWSVYALYKIAIGNSDSILGMNISKVFGSENKSSYNSNHDQSSVASTQNNQRGDNHDLNNDNTSQQQDSNIYSSSQNSNINNNQTTNQFLSAKQNFRNQLLQEVLAKRRQLFGNTENNNNNNNNNNIQHQFLNDNAKLYENNPHVSANLITSNMPLAVNNVGYKNNPPYQTNVNENDLLQQVRARQQQQHLNNNYSPLLKPKTSSSPDDINSKLLLLRSLPSLMQLNPNLKPGSTIADMRSPTNIQLENSELPEINVNHLLSMNDESEDKFQNNNKNDERDKEVAESNENLSEEQFREPLKRSNHSSASDSSADDSNQLSSDHSDNSETETNDTKDKDENDNNEVSNTLTQNGDDSTYNDFSTTPVEDETSNRQNENNSDDDNNTNNQDNNSSEDETTNDDTSLRETGKVIDEEVDRMTQPSSSDVVVPQQDFNQSNKPFDYTNTVQFDDSLSTSSAAGIVLPADKQNKNILQLDKKQVVPGNLIARFVDPKQPTRITNNTRLDFPNETENKKESNKRMFKGDENYKREATKKRMNNIRDDEVDKKIKRLDSDLQVDHNHLSVSDGYVKEKAINSLIKKTVPSELRKGLLKDRKLSNVDDDESHREDGYEIKTKKAPLDDMINLKQTLGDISKKSIKDKAKLLIKQRDKRSIFNDKSLQVVEKLTAPYEVDQYLDRLNFDNLIVEPTEAKSKFVTNRRKSKSLKNLNDTTGNSSLLTDKNLTDNQNYTLVNNNNRRSDYEEEDDYDENSATNNDGDHDDSVNHSDENNSLEDENNNPEDGTSNFYDNNINFKKLGNNMSPNYQYISSNDTDLQNLLAEKQLLDALTQSQLPPPITNSGVSFKTSQIQPTRQMVKTNYTLPIGTKTNDNNNSISPLKDHQTAGSVYTVDHGLLLYPSADEESHHKSKSESKKKKKHKKMKKKKKMTIAMKKGGHKKKKHKKIEKKYLKEKKFKGAKKGKKMSKGKGGQGGKKGKKLYKDKGFKKKGFKNVYHKEEFGQKKSYFDEYRDKDFKKKWKKFDDKYNYAQMKKWQAKDVKGAKKMKDHAEKFKKYDKSKWKKKYEKQFKEHSAKESMKKKKKHDGF